MTIIKNKNNRIEKIKMTEDEWMLMREEYEGVCLFCGETRDSCEPDASHYECEACGKNFVFGIEYLLVQDFILFEI